MTVAAADESRVAELKHDAIGFTDALVIGLASTALLELVERRGARLIVVGTSSERPLAGAILGSVPHKLLHRSRVPVLVVPAP